MALDAFMLPEGNLRYGMLPDDALVESYLAFRQSKENADTFLLRFLENPPFIPSFHKFLLQPHFYIQL